MHFLTSIVLKNYYLKWIKEETSKIKFKIFQWFGAPFSKIVRVWLVVVCMHPFIEK